MGFSVYRAVLHTSGKTREDILRQSAPSNLSDAEIADIIACYEAWDGIEVILTQSFSGSGWSLCCWTLEHKGRAKEAIYLMEQDSLFGTYINMREDFDRDWDAGEYCSDAMMHFNDNEVEILEKFSADSDQLPDL